ncbi:unnamed protein product [Microthlaspi erraticum]|uniref:BCAS3 domain-containing protein n=1 Tax=Microthlaspi erraticum TaxID=1685480 RepID=A0A6D2L8N5_9BRAS|nr:unnamed protein product [Microthlaspi erraticum]
MIQFRDRRLSENGNFDGIRAENGDGSDSLPEFVGKCGGTRIFKVPIRSAAHPNRPPSLDWFQELVLNRDDANNGGRGEMELEGIQTKTIEVRTRNLVPAYGYLRSPNSQQVTIGSFPSPSSSSQGDQMAPLEGHGTETEHGVVHKKEESLGSEGHGTETDLGVVHKKEESLVSETES